MTWAEVVDALERSGNVVAGEEHWRGLIVDVGRGRGQRLGIKLSYDKTAIVLIAQVCAEHYIGPSLALAYNGVIEHFALGLESGVYVLRQTRPLLPLTHTELALLLTAITFEAVRLHRALIQEIDNDAVTSLRAETFAHWL